MAEAFFSTRQGTLDSIIVYRYDFLDLVLVDVKRKEKFIYWLENKSGFLIYDIEDTCFFTFSKLPDDFTKQYRISSSKRISAPYTNTQRISNVIGTLLKNEMAEHYKQYLNQNIFVIETVDLYPFHLLKAIEFNVEVFPSGHFFIHFLPTSKIVSSKSTIDKSYISFLKTSNKNNSKTNEMVFTLVNTDKFYREKIDLLDKDLNIIVEKLLVEKMSFIATFDYHFVANYSPELFGKLTENTLKNLKKTIWFLNSILEKVTLPDFIQLLPEKFYKANILELENKQNLFVGCQSENITLHSKSITEYGMRLEYTRDDIASDELLKTFIKKETDIERLKSISLPAAIKGKVEQRDGWKQPHITQLFFHTDDLFTKSSVQSASYYNGIYRTVSNRNILPIVCDNLDISIFYDLLATFNKGASNFNIFPALYIPKNGQIDSQKILSLIEGKPNKTMIALFCQYQMPKDFFDPLRKFKFQIYQGETSNSKQNRAKLSNFTCKCLEKLGGIVAVIADTYISEKGYFIGIDLGHTTTGDEKFSNLAVVIFDNHGIFIGKSVVEKIPRKENLIINNCIAAFEELSRLLKRKKLHQPKQIIIHRDGKLHSADVASLSNAVLKVWGDIQLDIVEIIKSGFPVIAMKDESGNAISPASGSSFQDNEHKYAILVTNTQADEHSAVIKPIIIKHKFGEIDFNNIVEQVYWFTKIYTENLFNSTRLPATTLKANNFVGTSKKQHRATYLG